MSTIDLNSKTEITYKIEDLNLIIANKESQKERIFSLFEALFFMEQSINSTNFFTKKIKINLIYIDQLINDYTDAIINRINSEPLNSEGTNFTRHPSFPKISILIDELSKNLVYRIKSYNLKTIENVKNIFNSIVNRLNFPSHSSLYIQLFSTFINENTDDDTLLEILDGISPSDQAELRIYSYNIVALIIYKKILNKEKVSETVIDRCVKVSPEIGSLIIYLLMQEKVTTDLTCIFERLTSLSNKHFIITFNIINYYLETKQPDLAKEFIKSKDLKLTCDNKLDYSQYTYLTKAIHFYLKIIATTSTDKQIGRAILKIDPHIRSKFLEKLRKNNTLSQICKSPEDLLTFLFLKPASIKKNDSLTPPITQKFFCNIEVFKMLAMFPDFKLPSEANDLLLKHLELSLKDLCREEAITNTGLISYVNEINLALKNKAFRENTLEHSLPLFKIKKIQETPIVLKMIQNELYPEALLLIENGWETNELLADKSNAMHVFVKSTEYGLKCTNYSKSHFLNFCSALMTQDDLLNQENSFKQTPISLIKNISLAKEIIQENLNSINIPKLLKASIYSENVDLAIYLQERFAPDIEVDEDLLVRILNLLSIPGEYSRSEGFNSLLNTILTKMDGKVISPTSSNIIYDKISNYCLVNASFFRFKDFIEKLASKINFYPEKQSIYIQITRAPSKDIVHYVKILLNFDNAGTLANKAIAIALDTFSKRSPSSTHIKEIISLLLSYEKLDFTVIFETIENVNSDLIKRKAPMLLLIESIPSVNNYYIQDQHIVLYLLTRGCPNQAILDVNDPKNPSKVNYELLTLLIDKFDLNIDDAADRATQETIFSRYIRDYCFDSTMAESIYKKYKPNLKVRFKNESTIFHRLTEYYFTTYSLQILSTPETAEKTIDYIANLLKLFSDECPDWASYVGETKIPNTDYTMRASPATILQINDCTLSQSVPAPLSVDRLSEHLDMLYLICRNKLNGINTFKTKLNKINITSKFRPELFTNKEKNLRFFYLLCKYAPLSNKNGEINALLPILKEYINLPYHNGETPFQAAVKHNDVGSVFELIKIGGDTTIRLEGGHNIMHCLVNKASASIIPQIFNYVKNTKTQLCQFSNRLSLPVAARPTSFKQRHMLTIDSLKDIHNLPEHMIQSNSDIIKMGNIHHFLSDLLPNVNKINTPRTLYMLVALGLLNYIPNLIKNPSELDLNGLSPSLKIMLCFKPKAYEFESVVKLITAHPHSPQNSEHTNVKDFFRERLESFRLKLFNLHAIMTANNTLNSDEISKKLLDNFADKMGVKSSSPDLNDDVKIPDEINLLFLDYFYIQHQVNILAFLLQDEFIKIAPTRNEQLVNYLSSLAPKGVNKEEFLSQVINTDIATQQSKLTVYGAMMILVDLNMYEQSEVTTELLNSLISNKCVDESNKESISLPIKRPRPSDDSERPNKKQKNYNNLS
ncbi:MAG: hypothetical protein VX777_07455 [Chlamydiota bacterium]|nr:hypothetical protein [Chlamydiota bacterium]